MNEDVLTALIWGDETETFLRIEELNFTTRHVLLVLTQAKAPGLMGAR